MSEENTEYRECSCSTEFETNADIKEDETPIEVGDSSAYDEILSDTDSAPLENDIQRDDIKSESMQLDGTQNTDIQADDIQFDDNQADDVQTDGNENGEIHGKNEITEGNLLKALIKFSIPLMLAILVQALYSVVDLIVVGQYGTKASVSAVSIGGQFMHVVTVIISGIAMGGTVIIGKYFGAKDGERCAKSVGNITLICGVVAVVLTIVSVALVRPIAHLLNVPQEAFSQYCTYVMVCGAGTVLIVAYNLFSAIFRGFGNSRLPFIIIFIASIVNIGLDMILVGVCRMDALGAALATVIAQGVSVAVSAVILKIKGVPCKVGKSDFKFNKVVTKELLKVGVPIALQDGLTGISFLLISAFINALGVVASASVGISERLYLFLIIVPMAFMSTTSTFVAQNSGAGNQKRAMHSFLLSLVISSIAGVVICLITLFCGGQLAGLFTKDAEVIASASEYLSACAYEYILTGIFYVFIGYFNGRGKSLVTMIQGITVSFGVRVPLSYAFAKIEGVSMFKIGTSVPISAAVALALCLIFFAILMISDNKKRKKDSAMIA